MVEKVAKLPVYAKATILILGLFALLAMLNLAQSIIVPLVFALIIAIVLHPVVNKLIQWRINRVLAIIITLILTVAVIAALGTLVVTQAIRFGESWPALVDRFTVVFNAIISWSSGFLSISPEEIHNWVNNTKSDLLEGSSSAIAPTLISLGGGLVILFLLPVYIFLILYYQPILLDFIRRVFVSDEPGQVGEIITQTKKVIQRYLVGLVIEAALIAAMEIAALLILGIEYALLLGILGALLNVIPYLGGLVAVAMPMMVALATKTSAWYAVYILVIYYIIQLIDNNYIVPKIVASKVKINALFSIIVVIAGNSLWGIPGMFLSIPILAIIKLICDHIESLKPWGALFGDTMPEGFIIKPILKKINKLKRGSSRA